MKLLTYPIIGHYRRCSSRASESFNAKAEGETCQDGEWGKIIKVN